jgi:HEAT repeat protein
MKCLTCWTDEECGSCNELIGGPDPKIVKELEDQAALEGAAPGRPLWVVVSPHFYVVTDLHRQVKVPTEGGAPRLASGHEIAHLYAQRAEEAYAEFVDAFGPRVSLGRPMAIYLFEKTARKEAVAAQYLGSPRTSMLYGGGSNRIAKGYAGNGFVGSLQQQRSDTGLHAYCRHMIGHILFSCWLKVSGIEKDCPIWAFVGVAAWLEKYREEHRDFATFCSDETVPVTGSGKDWDRKAMAIARGRLEPIETFFGKESMGKLDYDDHVRAWSYMSLMLAEDRERWLKTLGALRFGADEGAAFKEGLGITPDQFHERWVDRLSGRRDTMGEIRRDASEDPEEPSRRERERIRTTEEADVLAGLIRGLDVITDVRVAEAVVARMDHPSDLVKETIHLVLSRTKSDEVRAWLRTEGLEQRNAIVRAGVARALGAMKDGASREALETLLSDAHWLARAEAAWALQSLGDVAALPALTAALSEREPKTWILVADAVASFAKRDAAATLAIVDRLGHSDWQVRVTAARALARVGTEEAIDGLIKRFDLEGGRLHKELHAALKAVTRDDLGANPETWRTWWEKQKAEQGGLGPEPEAPRNPADDRYGPPTRGGPDDPHYYGRRIYSKSVGFVLDTSGSMDKVITIPDKAAEELGGLPTSATRMHVARGVLVQALEKLDPRTLFSLVFFSTDVRPWKDRLVPASPGNVGAAASAVRNAPPDGETNIHGALKAALGLHGRESLTASLDPIPDTVYFLTDGSPTRGEITEADALISWFENLNRYAKVELNVIALGNLGVDLPFLGRLARAGGGEFVHVPER